MSLNHKVILVAGAGGRIGKSIIAEILDQGGSVMAADNSKDALENLKLDFGQQKQINYIELDITNIHSIKTVFENTILAFNKIDGAINTAYPRNINYGRHFLEVTFDDFSENLSLHLGGYFLFMQQCVKYALDSKNSFSLVNLSSIYGVIAPKFDIYRETTMTMPIEYAAIKSAIQHMVSYVTAFTKGSKFRVNCVSPGGILSGQDPHFIARYKAHCRDKGMLEPADIVGAITFFLSDAAEYICGQNIVVDDGFHN